MPLVMLAEPPGRFSLRIVVPTLLSVLLFVLTIYMVLIPALESSILERKREMIRELTTSAWNILANFEAQEKGGRLSRSKAQARAVAQIRNLHYGTQMKDYFWINDMHPRMVAHPYRHDLEGQDLTGFADPDGKRLFVEFVDIVRREGAGYVTYRWQWRDDPTHIVPKLSYVKGFKPWGWIIGTGVYLDDVRGEIRQVTGRLAAWSTAILAVIGILLFFIVRQSWVVERSRRSAETALRDSEARYRTLVESAGESILMELGEDRLYANASASAMLGYSPEEMGRMRLDDLIVSGNTPGKPGDAPAPAYRCEATLRHRDGTPVHALLSYSPITVGEKNGWILVATDITQRKHAEQELGRSEAQLQAEVIALRERQAKAESAVEDLHVALALVRTSSANDGEPRFLEEIRKADTAGEVVRLNRALPVVVRALSDSGARSATLNRLITMNTDAVVDAIIRISVAEIGPPPAAFAFLIMGSEGRREQTLRTDQDNAIVFADMPEPAVGEAREYFLKLGRRICSQLDEAGYSRCEHRIMAENPEWVQPYSAWVRMFAEWIRTQEAEDLLQTKIFFDFRNGYGDASLVDALRQSLWARLDQHPEFFSRLARNVLLFAPPLGVFGQFVVESLPDGRKALNIKSAMTPIVDFARIYALRHRIGETNTLLRLEALRNAGIIPPQNCQEVSEVYAALMQARIAGQIQAIVEGRSPDNYVDPTKLTYMDQRLLKESFVQTRRFQTRLSYDFTGLPEAPA
jgi:PAS domain S-box-containing protein